MGRLASVFERTRSEGRAALITYLCAGDPDLEQTIDRVVAAGDAGADIVELGIPFSDPTADGIAIQQASERALASGTTVKKILDAVVEIRKRTSIPIMLFGYYNPILAFGEERLAREAASAGVDGVLVVDLPPEEAELLRGFLVDQHLDLVPLVAPTSTDARIDAATKIATSFLYCVSVTGVTGSQNADLSQAAERASMLQKRTGKPVAVGFGVKDAADARALSERGIDGVVVGSAIVRAGHEARSSKDGVKAIAKLIGSLRVGVDPTVQLS